MARKRAQTPGGRSGNGSKGADSHADKGVGPGSAGAPKARSCLPARGHHEHLETGKAAPEPQAGHEGDHDQAQDQQGSPHLGEVPLQRSGAFLRLSEERGDLAHLGEVS